MAPPDDASPAVEALQDLCRRLTVRNGFLGVAVNLTSGRGTAGVMAASDERCRRLDELQFSAGEGPCYDAVLLSRPVLTPDLAADGGRWPGYASTAIEAGVTGVFAFPMQVGALCLGVLDVYAAQSGSLLDDELAAALTNARRATEILLDGGPGLGDEIDNRAEIYQAQGVIMAARGIDAGEALARMRAHAFARNQALLALALEILAGHHLLEDE
jgi:hypothetical protein